MDLNALIAWYRLDHRPLPWREIHDPYRIWLSEVILQQTRVAQGLEYYLRFTERYPTVQALAAADEDEVLKLWQGLGYYSRARNLHAAARQVVTEHGGHFPTDYASVRALRGVGDYTAAAIVSFSTDAPHAVLDGNVYRVLSRLLDLDTPIDTPAGKRLFTQAADTLLQEYLSEPGHSGAGIYNQAIMELGAILCTPRSPQCEACPLGGHCLARRQGTVDQRPVKQGRTTQTPRFFHYLHLTDASGQTVIYRRDGQDIWKGLYEFPLIESPSADTTWETLPLPLPSEALLWRESVRMPKHVLSHRIIHATFHRAEIADLTVLSLPPSWRIIPAERLGDYAVSRLTDLYLNRQA